MLFTKKVVLFQLENVIFSLFLLLLPIQLGKHFWPEFAIVNGIRVDYLSPTFYLTDGLLLFLFIISLPKLIKSTFHKSTIVFWMAVLYFGIVALSSTHIQNGIYSFIKFLELAFLCWYVSYAVPRHMSFQRLTSLLAFGVIGESFLAIAQFIQQSSVGGILYFLGERSFNASTPGIANASLNGELVMRAYGTFPHPNALAGYLLISMVLVFLILFASHRKNVKLLATSALLLGTIGLILTLSRVAILLWFGFVIMVFVWQIVRRRLGKTKRNASIALVVLFITGIAFSQLLIPRFLQTALTDESVVQREVLIKASTDMIKQNLWIGVGPGNFLPALSEKQTPLSLALYLQPVHNIFLLIAVEIGLIGLLFFLGLIGKSYQKLMVSLKSNKQSNWQLAILISLSMILIIGLFDHYWITLQQGQLLFVLILGLAG